MYRFPSGGVLYLNIEASNPVPASLINNNPADLRFLTEVHFNTIVLLALYLSLPRPKSKRWVERLIMGWSVLYLTQALNLVFHVKCLYALGLGRWSELTYSDLARNVYGYLRYFTDLPGRFSFPFLIWLGFNWDEVVAVVGLEPRTPAPRGAGRARRPRR